MAEGKIVTFYSFKGGVGRTMALANVAWMLASNGLKVLVADWDLDSPGLHKYFHPFLDSRLLVATPGIIELINEYAWAATSYEDRAGDWHLPYAEILPHAVSMDWRHFPEGASLDFVSAGRQNRDYSAAVASVDWDNFYERMGGGRFFEALRASMKRDYDYTFIDSRSGLSDIASICTVQLPDVLVDCFTLNDQSMEGAAGIARSIDLRHAARNIRILPVPMRIEDAENERLDAGRSLARARFGRFPRGMEEDQANAYWHAVEIPYKPLYAYEEMLAAFGEAPGLPLSLLSAYERLASAIIERPVTLPPMDEGTRLQYKDAFTRRRMPPPADVYLSYVTEDRQWADWIAAVLGQARFRVRQPTDNVPAGSNERDEAARGAAAANLTVAVVSPAYLRSPQSRGVREALADDLAGISGRLIPVRVSETLVSEPFADRTVLDLTRRDAVQAAEGILRALGHPVLTGDRYANLVPQEPRYPRTIPPVWNAPTRNAGFTGRNETLDLLRHQLLGSSKAVVLPLALYGYGGVGKTQVALEYTHRYMAEYDVVWWVPSGQPDLITPAFAKLASQLGLRVGDNITDAAAAAREALRRGDPYSRWLLIFDNAEEPADLEAHLPNGPGHVLVTSRNPTWARVAAPVEIDVFARGESLEHLRRRVPSLSREEADLVADALGDLPIAVEQAGSWLAETGTPPTDYVAQLSASSAGLLALNTPDDYPTPIAATWRLAFDRLRAQSPAAARLLQLCAFFAPEPISLSLLYSDQMISALRVFDPQLRERRMLARLIREIARYSLAKVDPGSNTIQVHRLIQDVIRASMETEAEIDAATHNVHKVLAGARPSEGGADNPSNWHQYDLLWPHLGPSRAAECDDDDTRQLLIDRMRYLWRRRAFDEALSFGSRLAALWTGRLGADDMQTLHLRFHIANVLRSQGEYGKAFAEDTAVHASQRAALGKDHVHRLQTAGSMAADLRGLGQFQRALEMDQETYDSLKELNGAEDTATLSAANNLAIDLRLIGDCFQARDLDRATLNSRRLVLGEEHPYTLHSAAMLARDLREAGDYHGSTALLRKAHSQYVALLGDDDLDTLSTAKSLAVSLRKSGKCDEAFELTTETRQRYRQRYGRHPDALACELNLACDLSALGDKAAAYGVASEVHQHYERSLGGSHPFTLAVASNLAGYLRGTGAVGEALLLVESTLRSLRDNLGGAHPYPRACALTMANCLHDLGQFEDAEALERETVALLRKTQGDSHPDTLIARANLAVIVRAAGRADEATRLQRQVLAAMAKSPGPLGEEHPSTAALRNWTLQDSDLESQPV